MSGEQKNLRDSLKDTSSLPVTYQSINFGSMSYKKTTKLITALYMVTDMIDKDEPLRNKLRTLGAEIISDTNATSLITGIKINEIMSFLEIASAVNIISLMNCSILKKEFLELKKSVEESRNTEPTWLENFLETETPSENKLFSYPGNFSIKDKIKSIGHIQPTRIGVQKGSTLMKALSDKALMMSDKRSLHNEANNFELLKKERRQEIISIIKDISSSNGNFTGSTITDIKSKAHGSFASSSEKTLQRELVSMVRDNVLGKVGSKRWSRYYLLR